MSYEQSLETLIKVLIESGYTKEQAVSFALNLNKEIITPKTEGK
jgi:hypothetical protein